MGSVSFTVKASAWNLKATKTSARGIGLESEPKLTITPLIDVKLYIVFACRIVCL